MNAERRIELLDRLDELASEVASSRAGSVEVAKAALAVADECLREALPNAWHAGQLSNILLGLAWNEDGRLNDPKTIVGLRLAVSAIKLLIAPWEQVTPGLRTAASNDEVSNLIDSLREYAVRAE